MTIFRIVEFDENGIEAQCRDFQSYEECNKEFKKRLRYWRKVEKEGKWLNFKAIEHTPFSCSFYQNNEIQWTWEMMVIPDKKA